MKRLRLFLLAVLVALAFAELLLQAGYFAMWALGSRPERPAATAAGPLVLCIGDSFTYGMGSSSPSKSYPGQLEPLLRAAGDDGGAMRVENRGWPGRNSREVLEALDGLLTELKPEVVCITVGVNDSWALPERLQLPPWRPAAAAPAPAGREYVWTFRIWRMIQAFRTTDPFRDQRTGEAIDDAQAIAVLTGKWRALGEDFRLALAADGNGRLGDNPIRWSARGDRLTLTLTGAPEIEGTWQLDQGALTYAALGKQLRLVRDDVADTRANPAAEGYKAMNVPDWPAALAAFRESVATTKADDPELPKLHAALARCHVALGNRAEAEAELATVRAIAEARADMASREALATALTALGHEEESDLVVERAIRDGARTPGLWTQYAQLTEKRGDVASARKAIDTAIELAVAAKWTGFSFLYRTKARLCRATNEYDVFAGAAVDGHLQDRRADATRQLLLLWTGPKEAKVAAMQRACEERKLAAADAKAMTKLLGESLGEGGEEWQETLRDHLKQAIRRCREAGAEPVLGTYPFQFGSRWMLQALAKEEGVPFVENDTAFAAIRQKEPGRTLTVADGHCNDDGYGVMAGCFAEAIRALRKPAGR